MGEKVNGQIKWEIGLQINIKHIFKLNAPQNILFCEKPQSNPDFSFVYVKLQRQRDA